MFQRFPSTTKALDVVEKPKVTSGPCLQRWQSPVNNASNQEKENWVKLDLGQYGQEVSFYRTGLT